MNKAQINVSVEILVNDYLELLSSTKVAMKHNISITAVKRILKEAGVLKTLSEAAHLRSLKPDSTVGKYKRTEAHKKNLSECAKARTGEKNPFTGKTHTEEAKKKIGASSKERTGKRNGNYKDGKYVRRPRDYKIIDFTKVRNFVFNRDKHTCSYCKQMGGHLHAHHILPFWVKKEAFLDSENLITVCTECHFQKAHLSNWHHFDETLITDALLIKYSLDRERLNELARFEEKREAIV